MCMCCVLQVNESLLVRDVLYACQGVAGRYTVYKDKAGLQVRYKDIHDTQYTIDARLGSLFICAVKRRS